MDERPSQTFQQFCAERRRNRRRLALAVAVLAAVAGIATFTVGRALDGFYSRGIPVDETEQRASAAHEAGHVVVGLAVMPETLFLSVEVRTKYRRDGLLGQASWFPRIKALTAEEMRQSMARLCGGRAADVLLNGAPTEGAGHDLKEATELARNIHFRYGLGATLTVRDPFLLQDWFRIETEMQAACRRAERIVAANKDLTVAIVDLIMSQPDVGGARTVPAETLYSFLVDHGGFPLEPPAECIPGP